MSRPAKKFINNRYLIIIIMKLQNHISRKVGDKEYTKSWVVIPNEILKELGWESGQELKAEVKKDKLVIEKED